MRAGDATDRRRPRRRQAGTAVLTTERDNDGAKAFYEATGWSPVHEPFVVAGVEMTVFGRALR
ncbi:hypothetical protein [Halosegnis marinus]|uniref:hypothetical protein n=1 Tax=Halosegnis marinus TaxID=3034023 RepID=UPI0036108FB2